MKLQVAFDLLDLDQALNIARQIEESADVIEVGSLLIYRYGVQAVSSFKEAFPHKTILADAKIVTRSKEAVSLFAQAGASWVTVLAGAGREVIKTATTTAHELGCKVMLDLIGSNSLGQAALEAQTSGADAVLLYQTAQDQELHAFIERWEMVRGNTNLPVYLSPFVSRSTINDMLQLAPSGIVIGKAITFAENPREEAAYFAQMLKARQR